MTIQGYCLKDKKKVDIINPAYELNKKGRPVVRGTCKVCGGIVYKILKESEVPADLKAKMPKKGGASPRKSRKSHPSTGRKSKKSKSAKPKSRKSRKSKSRK